MKQVISGLTYNTDTATEIGYANLNPVRDFTHYEESLYVTKKGRYFLAGRGGPMTRYGYSPDGNITCGGSGIVPIDKEEALEWCEMHDIDPDIIEHVFDIEEA